MNTMARFQDAFAEALHDEDASFAPARQAAFAIYRNTAMRGCLDALEANYPAVVCLVGREWFRAAAAVHVAQSPPQDGRLVSYGSDFADFLGTFGPASGLPYLADVARLDRLWTESFIAEDAAVLDAAAIASFAADSLGALRPRRHPALRTFRSPLPAVSIWMASRHGLPASAEMVWQPEHAIVTRVGHAVCVTPVDAPTLRFIDAIGQGATLADAATSTLTAHPDARVDLLLAGLLQAGAFAT